MSECACGIPRACNEAHERPEGSSSGRPKKVQPRQRRFEAICELRVAVDKAQQSQQIWCKKRAAGNVDTVTSGEQGVIDAALAAIVKSEPDLLADGIRGDDDSACRDSYPIHPGR
jgi:hypothetical protein